MDRFSRIFQVLVVLLLAAIAFRPLILPQPVHASGFTQYDVYIVNENKANDLSVALTEATRGGWEVVGITALPDFAHSSNAIMVLLAR